MLVVYMETLSVTGQVTDYAGPTLASDLGKKYKMKPLSH